MAKKKTKEKPSRWQRIKRNAITVAVVAFILYIGVHMLSRTDGVRAAVADKISNGTRQPVSIEACGATPLLGLRIEGLSFPGVEMFDIKLSFNWFALLTKDRPLVKQLSIEKMEVRFRRVPVTGSWDPLVLNGVGQRLGAVMGLNPVIVQDNDELPKFPSFVINQKTLLQVKRGKVVWNDEQGRELAYISDADMTIRAGSFINRKVLQTIVECGHIKLASHRVLRNFRLEAFRVEGSGWVTVLEMADSNGQYPEFASDTLWQDLNVHLNQLLDIRQE
jgi:hypothetical protein